MERRLSAVLSADVVGYSRLMGTNEVATLTSLNERRNEILEPAIATHKGRVVKLTGDGLLAEFASVVGAVESACRIQQEMRERNAGLPEDRRIEMRIGINLGDVIAEDDDIYGDGVNIAARLQASARPGGIVISHTVYDQVRNKVAVGFDFLGALNVKNIEEGVPSYAVRIGEFGNADAP